MLDLAISKFPSKAAFCRKIGMTPQFLSQIESGKRKVPARYAVAIERLTEGTLPAHIMRPDIWPDSTDDVSTGIPPALPDLTANPQEQAA